MIAVAALAFAAGVGPQFLAARWPDERAIYREIAEEAAELRKRERRDLAVMVGNELSRALGG